MAYTQPVEQSAPRVLWECRWWRVEERVTSLPDDGDRYWYSVHRPDPNTVTVLGVTSDGRVPVVRQHRIALGAMVWELPAGIMDADGESLEQTAARELEEETGWRAGRIVPLLRGPTSSGLTDEMFNGFLGLELECVGDGGGLSGEQIEVHLIPLKELTDFLLDKAAAGELVDVKCIAHVALAERKLSELGVEV